MKGRAGFKEWIESLDPQHQLSSSSSSSSLFLQSLSEYGVILPKQRKKRGVKEEEEKEEKEMHHAGNLYPSSPTVFSIPVLEREEVAKLMMYYSSCKLLDRVPGM